jgi:hypothetical protein
MINVLATYFHLPQHIIDDLEEYYLLHWSASYTFKKLRECPINCINPYITQNGKNYTVMLQNINYFDIVCSPENRQFKLSFRKAPSENHGIVIITPKDY